MHKRYSTLLAVLLALVIGGCSSLEVSQDYEPDRNFSSLKTFAWKTMDQPKTGDARIDSHLMDDRIRKATERELLEKGLTKASTAPPDFYIQYQYTISKKLSSRPVSTGFGVGYGSRGRYGSVGVSSGSEITEYNEGLLVIDFLTQDRDSILWRGQSTRTVKTHSTPEKNIQDIDKTIKKMLDQFPPGP